MKTKPGTSAEAGAPRNTAPGGTRWGAAPERAWLWAWAPGWRVRGGARPAARCALTLFALLLVLQLLQLLLPVLLLQLLLLPVPLQLPLVLEQLLLVLHGQQLLLVLWAGAADTDVRTWPRGAAGQTRERSCGARAASLPLQGPRCLGGNRAAPGHLLHVSH